MTLGLPERFEKHISPEPNSGCWLWVAARDGDGYGRLAREGISRLVHREVYELLIGPIPKGLQIDHLCRVPCCCNPQHLEPVTQAENVRRGAKYVTACPRGHTYTIGNTVHIKSGSRVCLICKRANDAVQRARKRRLRSK